MNFIAKTVKAAALALAAACMVACSTTSSSSSASSTNSAAYSAGSSFSNSLMNLYSSYQSSGKKLDMSDATTLLNVGTLATSCATVKSQAKTSETYKSFVKGALASSKGLLNASNIDSVISSVTSMDLNALKNSSAVAKTTNVVNGLSTILNAFK